MKINGFGVVEILIVLVIIAILTVSVNFRFTDYSINFTSQLKQLANDLRYTQNLAMTKNQHFSLVVINKNSYVIQDQSGQAINNPINLVGITIQTSKTSFSFNSKGIPLDITQTQAAPEIQLIHLTGQQQQATIQIIPITGKIMISTY